MFQNKFALPEFQVTKIFCLEEKTEKESNKQILCVEDHEDTCELYSLLLPEYDFTFTHTQAESLAMIEKRKFDLYMLDNWLPDGSGIKLCREIRALHPDAPIIFVSGITRKKETQEALDAGANEYLVKPCDPDKLQKIVKELIEK
jgi:two-component system repressor protein LuxO